MPLNLLQAFRGVEGGGVVPIITYMRRLHPKGGTFFRLQVYKRVGILLLEVYEMVGKSVIYVCKKT